MLHEVALITSEMLVAELTPVGISRGFVEAVEVELTDEAREVAVLEVLRQHDFREQDWVRDHERLTRIGPADALHVRMLHLKAAEGGREWAYLSIGRVQNLRQLRQERGMRGMRLIDPIAAGISAQIYIIVVIPWSFSHCVMSFSTPSVLRS
jgi:hypothetical protein